MKNQAYAGTSQTRKAWLRKTLTVTQFTISQILLIATLVVGKQIHYSLNKELGYKKDAIVFFNTRGNFYSQEQDLKPTQLYNKLKSVPEIEMIALSGSPPASSNTSTTSMKYNNGKQTQENMVEIKYANRDFFDLYKLKLLAGDHLQPSDTMKEFIINETYSKLLGFARPEEAIGHFIERDNQVPIVGVVADFHTKSTHDIFKPLAFTTNLSGSHTIHVVFHTQGNEGNVWSQTLKKVENKFKETHIA